MTESLGLIWIKLVLLGRLQFVPNVEPADDDTAVLLTPHTDTHAVTD